MAGKKGKSIDLTIVGCGGMAGAHLNGYEELMRAGEGRFRIVAAVDEVKERAEAFSQRLKDSCGFDVQTFKTIDQLLNSGLQVDGADICSPHGLHHVLSCELMAGGINVLCEKPIGVTVKASKKIAAMAKKTGLVAATAEQCRRSIGQRTIHWAFNDGLLGQPRLWWAIAASWNDPAQIGGWHRYARERDDTIIVRQAADIERAKAEGSPRRRSARTRPWRGPLTR